MAARKTSTAPTRVWKFGCRVAPESASLVHDLAWACSRYYNALVEIERRRHARFVAIRRSHAPELAELEDEWERLDDEAAELVREIKRSRQTHWRETGGEKTRAVPADAQARLDEIDREKRRVSAAAKEHRTAFAALCDGPRAEFKRRATERADGGGPRVKGAANAAVLAEMLGEPEWHPAWKEIAQSDDAAHRESIAAREACALPTGTYLQVEEAFQRARKDSSPRPPRFRRFDGRVKLSVQIRDMTWSTMGGRASCTRAPHDPRRGGDQSRMHVVRIDQSIPRGERQAVIVTAKLHRQPPVDAVVKWVSLVGRRVGQRDVYEVQVTMEHPSFAEAKRPAGSRAAEHIAIGWSRVADGVRVARWADGEVVVPTSILRQHEHAASVDGVADALYDRARRLLRRWMRSGPHRFTAWHRMGSDRARAMMRRACREYADWALGDAHGVWRSWKTDRLSRGEDLYAPAWLVRRWLASHGVTGQVQAAAFWAYVWSRKDEHLCQLAVDSRRRFVARRDAYYRSEAIRIATEFSEVTVDKYSVAALRVLPELTMPGDPPRETAQHNAQAAAPGRFREILIEVMGSRCERSSGSEEPGTARKRKRSTSRAVAVSDAAADAAAEE